MGMGKCQGLLMRGGPATREGIYFNRIINRMISRMKGAILRTQESGKF